MPVARLAAALLFTVLVATVQACSTGCDRETIGRAITFIDAHQACTSVKDCVVIPDACGNIPGGFCGQLALNRQAAQSPEWASIADDLDDCSPDSCAECDGLLNLTCTNGCCTEGKCPS